MSLQKTPFDHTYRQSYLLQAGVRFDFNVVDTVCNRKLSLIFYLAVIAALLLIGLLPNLDADTVGAMAAASFDGGGANSVANATAEASRVGHTLSTSELFYSILLLLLVAYILFYLFRLAYYVHLRYKLRQDHAPIAVEAYAVVCLDLKRKPIDYLNAALGVMIGKGSTYFCKYAVIYKESGTTQPRFFLTAALPSKKLSFIPDHVGLVFIHRKKPHLYSVDDKSSYQTVSERRLIIGNMLARPDSMAPSEPELIDEKNQNSQS